MKIKQNHLPLWCPTLILPLVIISAGSVSSEEIEEVSVEESSEALAEDYDFVSKIPGGPNVIDTTRLRQKSLQNLADVLRFVPGVWAASANGGQGVFFSSRGSNLDATNFDNNGIKLLQDGLPVTTADGNNHNRVIDPLSSRSAVFAKGANAYSLGASTLGGAINFNSPAARDVQGTQVRLNSGSNELIEGRVSTGVVQDSWDGLLTVESRSWGGFREHNEEKRVGIYANSGWQVNDQIDTRLYFTYLDSEQEIPGSLTQAQLERDSEQASFNALAGNFQLDVETRRIASKTKWQLTDNQRLEFGLSYEDQELFHPIVSVFANIGGVPTNVFSLLIDTDHQDVGGVARYYLSSENHDFTLGVNYGKNQVEGEHFTHEGARPIQLSTLIDNTAETWEIYAQDQWRLSPTLDLILAVQGVIAERETRSTSINPNAENTVTNPKGDYDAINPRIGVLWQVSENSTIYSYISRLYEPPTNFELQDDTSNSNNSRDIEPLEAMHGTVFEFGARGSFNVGNRGQGSWDITTYYAAISNEILSRDNENAPGQSLVTNFDSTVHAGVEGVVTGDFFIDERADISISPLLSVTFNQFTFDDDPDYGNNDLPAAPEFVVRGEFIVRHSSGLYFGPVVDFVGARWADFENSYKVDNYQLLGLRGGYESKHWRTFLEIQNLLDEEYVSSHSVRDLAAPDEAILNPGVPLSAYIGIEFRL